jgi:hypothetical protein
MKNLALGSLILVGIGIVGLGGCSGDPDPGIVNGGGSGAGEDAGGSIFGSSSGSSPGTFASNNGASQTCSQVGQTQACWTGDPSERGKGACHDGIQTCVVQSGGEIATLTWGPCTGEQTDCGPAADAGVADDASGGTATVIDAGPQPGCSSDINTEPDIISAYEPMPGATVSRGGQIKVWVDDECAPMIAPGEQVDPTTGAITVPGDLTAQAPDGYPWEPLLYIGGVAHIPSLIKGTFNSDPNDPNGPGCRPGDPGVTSGPPIDPNPAAGSLTAEYVWDVNSLGLSPGTYDAEFVIRDGDRDRGIGCVTIVIGS